MAWFRRRRASHGSADLDVLASADTVAFGGVGIASVVLPATAAYDQLAAARDPALRPALERLVATATPAGKVYAATLLGRLDPAAGRAAWHRLAQDRSRVQTFSGCMIASTTLAEYATARLGPA